MVSVEGVIWSQTFRKDRAPDPKTPPTSLESNSSFLYDLDEGFTPTEHYDDRKHCCGSRFWGDIVLSNTRQGLRPQHQMDTKQPEP